MKNFCMVIDQRTDENFVEIYSDNDELEALAIIISDYAVTPKNYKQYMRRWPGYVDEYNLYVLNEKNYGHKDLLRWADQYKADDNYN